MNKKKLTLIGVSSVFVIAIFVITLSLALFKSDDNVVLSDNANDNKLINNSFLTLMLEQSDGTYQESKSNTWPSGNYAFNSELSRCENGGELRWNREEGIVELLSNKSDGCYVYFDLYDVVTITNVQAAKTTNSVTLTVTVDAGENPVATYYFSIDGGRSYEESTSPNYTFSELTPNTTYTFQVYAKDTLGYVSNEEVIEVTTDNYVNPVVNSVTATNVSNDSITVSVSATGGTNAIQTYHYSINNGAYTSSSSNTHTFSGLTAGTNYSIRVYVTDTNGVDSNIYTINTETTNLTYICDSGTTLASCIRSQYTSQGSNGIYYHTSSLVNSAEDNSYRYAGANPNNYVCFGSDEATCPSDNLYRIIGVFGDEVKLIKNTSIGNYFWSGSSSSSSTNTWSNSTLNTSILNGSYLAGLDNNSWSSMITTHNYKVGGMTRDDSYTAKQYYDVEVGANSSSSTPYNAKIGLMYVSDYGFAASNTYWSTNLGSYNSATSNNWLYLGSTEWTISRRSGDSRRAFLVGSGNVFNFSVYGSSSAVRPVFYLNSNVQYSSGTGTSSDPVRIVI